MSDDLKTLVSYLRTVPFFRGLTEDDLLAIAQRMELVAYASGSTLFGVGDVGDAMYIVHTGEVEILTAEGAPIAVVGPGSFLGEVGLLTGRNRSVEAVVVSDSMLWVLRRDAFEALVEERPALAMVIARALARRGRGGVPQPSATALQSVALFQGVGEDALNEIASLLESMFFPAGSTIYNPGDVATHVYVVASGEVSVRREAGGQMIELYRAGTGEVFGEEEVLTGEPRVTAAVALGPVGVWALPGQTLEDLVARYPRIGLNLARVTSARVIEERPVATGEALVPVAARAVPAAEPTPRKKRHGWLTWYRYMDRATRMRVIALVVLLAWLAVVSLPAMAREAVEKSRMYAQAGEVGAGMTVIGNSPAGVALAPDLELAYPTPTYTPPPTPTPGD